MTDPMPSIASNGEPAAAATPYLTMPRIIYPFTFTPLYFHTVHLISSEVSDVSKARATLKVVAEEASSPLSLPGHVRALGPYKRAHLEFPFASTNENISHRTQTSFEELIKCKNYFIIVSNHIISGEIPNVGGKTLFAPAQQH